MINAEMRTYNYHTYGQPDEYGQAQLSEALGTVKMAIATTSQTIQDNINYKGANYIGLTHNAEVNDTYVIEYGEERLKVLYVTPGRLNQVYMVNI